MGLDIGLGDNRWQGYSHQELYTMLHAGPGPAAAGATADRWSTMAGALSDIQQDISAGVTVHIEVDCLNVIGNFATISGIVTRSSDPTRVPEGFEGIFQVVDNGEGKDAPPDFMSEANFFAVGTGTDCRVPGEFDLVPVEHGNVQVD